MMFGPGAARLAGAAGALLGWSPDQFWAATPSELAGVLTALTRDAAVSPPTQDDLAHLMEAFPDG